MPKVPQILLQAPAAQGARRQMLQVRRLSSEFPLPHERPGNAGDTDSSP